MRRAAAFGIGAIAGGALAAAATIVDPSKAEQYLTAGIYGGGKLAQGISDKAASVVDIKGATNAFKRGYLGEKYDDIDDAIYKTNYGLDYNNVSKAVQKLGIDKAKDLLKQDGLAHHGIDRGIYNIDDLIKIYKGKEKYLEKGIFNGYKGNIGEKAEETAFQAFRDKVAYGDIVNNPKKYENFRKQIRKDIIADANSNGKSLSEYDIERQIASREDAIRILEGYDAKYSYGPNGIILNNKENKEETVGRPRLRKAKIEREPTNEEDQNELAFLKQSNVPDLIINADKEINVYTPLTPMEIQKVETENNSKREILREQYGGKELGEETEKAYQSSGIYKLEDMYEIDAAKEEFLKNMKNSGLSTEESEKRARDMSIAAYRLNNQFGDLTNEKNYQRFKKFAKEKGYTPEEEQNLAKTMTYYNGYTDRNIDAEALGKDIENVDSDLDTASKAEEEAYKRQREAEDNAKELNVKKSEDEGREEGASISIEAVEEKIKEAERNGEDTSSLKQEKAQYEEMKKQAGKDKKDREDQIKQVQEQIKEQQNSAENAKSEKEDLTRRKEILETKEKAKKSRDSYEATKERYKAMKERNKGEREDTAPEQTERRQSVRTVDNMQARNRTVTRQSSTRTQRTEPQPRTRRTINTEPVAQTRTRRTTTNTEPVAQTRTRRTTTNTEPQAQTITGRKTTKTEPGSQPKTGRRTKPESGTQPGSKST